MDAKGDAVPDGLTGLCVISVRYEWLAGLGRERQTFTFLRQDRGWLMAAAMVRVQALRGYRHLVADLGGDLTALLRRAGIEVAALDQLTALISFEAMTDLLEYSSADLDCPDFGLRLADRQDLGTLGTLAVAMRYAATVGEALRCASQHLDIYNPAIGFTINSGGQADRPASTSNCVTIMSGHWAQTAEHGIGLGWRTVNMLCEGRCPLRGVWFPHPALGSLAAYHSRFDAPLTFNADHAALAIDASYLDLPISGRNSELHDAATRYLDTRTQPEQHTCQADVRRSSKTYSAPEPVAANTSPTRCTCTRAPCNAGFATKAPPSKKSKTRHAATSPTATCPTPTYP